MYFHLINLAVYTVFLAALTICGIELMSPVVPLNGSNWNESSLEQNYLDSHVIYENNLVKHSHVLF